MMIMSRQIENGNYARHGSDQAVVCDCDVKDETLRRFHSTSKQSSKPQLVRRNYFCAIGGQGGSIVDPSSFEEIGLGSSIHVRAADTDSDNEGVDAHVAESSLASRSRGGQDTMTGSYPTLQEAQAHACEKARKQFNGDLQTGRIQEESDRFPRFSKTEILEGRFLGRGSSGVVVQINGFRLRAGDSVRPFSLPNHDDDMNGSIADFESSPCTPIRRTSSHKVESRNFIIKHCYRQSGDARYVVKQLRKDVISDPKKLLQGLADLNLETKFLSSLPHHPNIVKLRAIANGDRFHPDYFIVIDRLCDTLEARIIQWKAKAKGLDAKLQLFRAFTRSSRNKEGLSLVEARTRMLHDKVWTAYDLSSAIAHLHKHSIMHRDIKPTNIGFDIRNDVKIFDFGLGKEIPSVAQKNLETTDDSRHSWNLTRMVGTPRYMAPEIAIGLPYNESCDVYSFGIVLWQIMTLNIKPYGRSKKANSIDFFVQSVWHGKRERPSMRLNGQTVRRNFLPIIQTLVQSCWSHEWQHRPTMEVVESTLRDEVLFYTRAKNASRDNVDMDLLNDSRHNSCLGDNMAKENPRLLKSSSTSSLQRLLQANQKKITSLGSNRTRSTSSTTLFNGDLSPRRFFQRKNHAFLLPDASARRLTHQSRRSTFLFDDAAARIPDPTLLLDDCDFCDDDDDSM